MQIPPARSRKEKLQPLRHPSPPFPPGIHDAKLAEAYIYSLLLKVHHMSTTGFHSGFVHRCVPVCTAGEYRESHPWFPMRCNSLGKITKVGWRSFLAMPDSLHEHHGRSIQVPDGWHAVLYLVLTAGTSRGIGGLFLSDSQFRPSRPLCSSDVRQLGR